MSRYQRSSRGRRATPRCGRGRSRRRATTVAAAGRTASGSVLAVEDPVVDVLLPRAELGRLDRVVQRRARRRRGRARRAGSPRTIPNSSGKSSAAPAALRTSKRPGARASSRRPSDAHGRVLLLHALPLGERVAEDHHAVRRPAAFGAERPVAEAQRVVARLDGPWVVALRSRRSGAARGGGSARRSPSAQVDVEVAARVRGVAVEERRPAPVEHASARRLGRRRSPMRRNTSLEQHRTTSSAAGGEREALQPARERPPTCASDGGRAGGGRPGAAPGFAFGGRIGPGEVRRGRRRSSSRPAPRARAAGARSMSGRSPGRGRRPAGSWRSRRRVSPGAISRVTRGGVRRGVPGQRLAVDAVVGRVGAAEVRELQRPDVPARVAHSASRFRSCPQSRFESTRQPPSVAPGRPRSR